MYLGIDLGTSELKALLLDDAHRIVATAAQPLTVQRPAPLWSEQQPAHWWQALDQALLELRSGHAKAMAAVRAIGLSGQMHGAVLIDANNEVLRPAMLWNDGRAHAQCAELEAAVPDARRITGNLAMPGFTAPKLLWLRAHEPQIFARTDGVLLPKDWLRLQLTGERISEMSDASGTLWLDVGARRWSPDMLAACGLSEHHMPGLVEGSAPSASLRAALAERWGLRTGIPVAGGGGDNAASAIGMGAVRPHQGFVSLGTSGVVFLVSDSFQPNPDAALHAFCHALPQTWHQMSVMLSAASALRWLRELLGRPEAELMAAAAALPQAERARAPLFLPYLAGERTPHNDATLRAEFLGLDHAHGAAHLAYAVAEGVAFGLADGWAAFGPSRHAVRELALVGGGARSAEWAQLLASALGLTLVRGQGGEVGGARGAARLAWLADGGELAHVCLPPSERDRFTPDGAETELLAPRQARFRAACPAVKGAVPA